MNKGDDRLREIELLKFFSLVVIFVYLSINNICIWKNIGNKNKKGK